MHSLLPGLGRGRAEASHRVPIAAGGPHPCCLGWGAEAAAGKASRRVLAAAGAPYTPCCLGWAEAAAGGALHLVLAAIPCCLGWAEAAAGKPYIACWLGWVKAVAGEPYVVCRLPRGGPYIPWLGQRPPRGSLTLKPCIPCCLG